MIVTVEQLKRVASAGGGLVLNGALWTLNDLRAIAQAAAVGGARITVRNISNLSAAQLEALAALAPGLIVFDISS